MSQPYLRFCLRRHVYQFRALCFGLSTAPHLFTRVIALVSEWVHRRGMRRLCYLDDWLVVAESRRDLLLQHWDLLVRLCDDLGIIVKWEKSDLQPSARHQYLGMLIDTSLERIFPSQACLARFGRWRRLFCSFCHLQHECGSSC